MASTRERLLICATDELAAHRSEGITHLVAVMNATQAVPPPAWYGGQFLAVCFGDVISEADARQWHTRAPTQEDVARVLQFCRACLRQEQTRVLLCCGQGASRSPALAYVVLADQFGPGREHEALAEVRRLRPQAIPNHLVVSLGDVLLARQGALLHALSELERGLLDELGLPPEF